MLGETDSPNSLANVSAEKILAIKFKYLGDVVVMVPALRALRAKFPDARLHVLVAAEAAPLLDGLPWIDRIWALPRTRGKLRITDSLPVIRQLRAEAYDRSVDFVGNDRGATLSRLVGAKERLGVQPQAGGKIRRMCYTATIEELDTTRHEAVRDYYVLTPWDVPPPTDWRAEVAQPATSADTCRAKVVCHLSTSQRKKEWPLSSWQVVVQNLAAAGQEVIISSGPSEREQTLLTELGSSFPMIKKLPLSDSLEGFMAQLAGAKLFISPDTAPLHIASGLGIPTIGLFGPTSPERWAPIGPQHHYLKGALCPCSGHLEQCALSDRCIDTIAPSLVVQTALEILQ